jgi:hypothetical protein
VSVVIGVVIVSGITILAFVHIHSRKYKNHSTYLEASSSPAAGETEDATIDNPLIVRDSLTFETGISGIDTTNDGFEFSTHRSLIGLPLL